MAKQFIYLLSVWLRLKKTCQVAELREFLEEQYCVIKCEVVNALKAKVTNGTEFSIQLQLTFDEQQMEDNEPTEDAISIVGQELRVFMKSKFKLAYLDLLDDALTSYLLASEEEPNELK